MYQNNNRYYFLFSGRVEDGIRLLLTYGQPHDALEVAMKGNDNSLIGECHYVIAKTINGREDPIDVLNHLNEARSYFAENSNLGIVAEINLLIGEITKDIQLIQKSCEGFSSLKPSSNDAGIIDALDMIKTVPHHLPKPKYYSLMLTAIKKGFSVIKVLMKPENMVEKATFDVYLKYFGIKRQDLNICVIEPNLQPRCLQVLPFICMTKNKTTHIEKSITDICHQISVVILRKILQWKNEVKNLIE